MPGGFEDEDEVDDKDCAGYHQENRVETRKANASPHAHTDGETRRNASKKKRRRHICAPKQHNK